MKRFLLSLALMLAQIVLFAQNECHTAEYRQQFLRSNPAMDSKIAAIETFTLNFQKSKAYGLLGANKPAQQSPFITIPVVVHVLYNSSQQNISDAQILSQIEILNQDYRRLNADTLNTPGVFQPVAADCAIQFALAKVDTGGYATAGIVRKHTSIQQFGINDAIKFSSMGGDDAWDKDSYLNIWVGNLTGGILGYSSVVGCPKENDGVVIQWDAFGSGGSAKAPYNKGRTSTHEIGHWLNLMHTWGDADCGDDHVDDTPPQQTADRGCPGGVVISCNNAPNGNMYPNYMDFTDDQCMNLFTYGQQSRMMALFQPGGERYALLSSNVLTAVPLPNPNPLTPEGGGSFISVYPNPSFTSAVTIQLSDDIIAGSSLEIYNQVGQKVGSATVMQPTFQLNTSWLSKGVYYIKVNDGKCKVIAKLVKL